LFEGHDRSKYEIYAYDFSVEDGTPHRQRLKKAIDQIRFVHALTDRQVAEVVLHDEIDVLIDLHGLSAGARPGIFALHPAPLQGTYLGFIGTTGIDRRSAEHLRHCQHTGINHAAGPRPRRCCQCGGHQGTRAHRRYPGLAV